MEWNKFYYNGYETNVEVTSDGRIRRIKTDWCKGTSLGDVDFSKLKDDGYYNRLKVMIKGLGRKTIKVHQIVASVYLGYIFNGYKSVIDHIDSNPKNNDISNLRVISHRENMSKERTLKSGLPIGVSFRKDLNKYQSHIRINGIKKHIGVYKTIKDAEKAYKNILNGIVNN